MSGFSSYHFRRGFGDTGAPLDPSIQATASLYGPGVLPPGVSYLPGNIPGVPQGFTTAPLSQSDLQTYLNAGFVADPNSAADTVTYAPSMQLWYQGPSGPVWLLSPQQQKTNVLNQQAAQAVPAIVVSSNGLAPQQTLPNPSAPPPAATSTGFSLSDVPLWAWLGVGIGAFLVLK